MPYFHINHGSTSYYCPNCDAWFYRSTMSCRVVHMPGDCCHEYEQIAPTPEPKQPKESE